MSTIGTVESLWRYPVKSMRGEELPELFAGYAGVYGDRLFAFESSASPRGFPVFHRTRSTSDDSLPRCSLRIGSKLTVAVLQRDARCMMITLDPDTAEKTPAILKAVAQAHEGMAGVYGAVLVEGMMRQGDSVELLN